MHQPQKQRHQRIQPHHWRPMQPIKRMHQDLEKVHIDYIQWSWQVVYLCFMFLFYYYCYYCSVTLYYFIFYLFIFTEQTKQKRNRKLSLVSILYRRIFRALVLPKVYIEHTKTGTIARCELDTHADTCLTGKNFKVMEYTGVTADVLPYDTSYQAAKDIPIVWAATAWTHPETGKTYVLDFYQILWYGEKMQNSLINPNQIRHYGHVVNDDPTDKSRPFGIVLPDKSVLDFSMMGTTLYFTTRVPTEYELEQCERITMTDDNIWDPINVHIGAFATMEEKVRFQLSSMSITHDDGGLSNVEDQLLCTVSPVFNHIEFTHRAIKAIRMAHPFKHTVTISSMHSNDRHSHVTAEMVARLLHCGLDTATKTLKKTTQIGIRHALHPLHRRYRVDHLDLSRRRLNATFYTDTLFTRYKSLNGNVCAQIYTNGHLTCVYPMEAKTGAAIGRTLTLFSEDVGIPDVLVMDQDPAQVGKYTEMQAEARRLRIKVKYTEKGRSWQNHTAEGEIGHLKKCW